MPKTVLLIVGFLLLTGCERSALGPDDGGAPGLRREVSLSPRLKVDVLFMLDNGNTFSDVGSEVGRAMPDFLQVFADAALDGFRGDLHLGVVTSDYGAGATGAPGCSPSPGGQRGRLQAIGAKAPAECKAPVATNFVRYTYDPTAGPAGNNLPFPQDLTTTLGCMTSVGSFGCGFRHPLESVLVALSGGVPENAGFLRDDALLAVLFVTDADDASAPPDSDLFDKNKVAEYGYEDSYSRQTRFAIVCCPPGRVTCSDDELGLPPYGDSGGPLSRCQAAANQPTGSGPGKTYDVRRYIVPFTRPRSQGGLKTDPLDVMLFAVDGPDSPFQVILSNPGTPIGLAYQQCAGLNETSNPPCVPVLQHACALAAGPPNFGKAAVRLNQTVRAAQYSVIANRCDNDYASALKRFAGLITGRFGAGCVPFALPTSNGLPVADCEVSDVSTTDETMKMPIPKCGGGTFPCWRLETKRECRAGSPDSVGITIDRNGASPRAGTVAKAACVAG